MTGDQTYQSLIDDLVDVDSIKVWSIIATIFGDMARGDMTNLTGTQIRQLLEPMGIKPEATRVALHRLAKDDWITSTRIGRQSQYELSDQAAKETAQAHLDVYRTDPKHDKWVQAVAEEISQIPNGVLILTGAVFVMPESMADKSHSFAITPLDLPTLPDWYDEKLVQQETVEIAEKLHAIADKAMRQAHQGTEIEKAVFRILIVHLWRKLALRLGTWFHIARYPQGVMAKCQKAVADVLSSHAPISVSLFSA